MKKRLAYAVKFEGEPHLVTRDFITSILKDTCIVKRHYSAMDKRRVFMTATGYVLYMQYLTPKQMGNWKWLIQS